MSEEQKFFGVYRGTVTNGKDPKKQRRIKAIVPQVLGEEPTDWMWPMDYYSRPPKTGQGVWVMFEGGDPSFPVWSSFFGNYKEDAIVPEIGGLKKGAYPQTVQRHIKEDTFDVIGAIADLAVKVEQIRNSLNSHGGGMSESPPDRVDP
jgi:hypothetical protein